MITFIYWNIYSYRNIKYIGIRVKFRCCVKEQIRSERMNDWHAFWRNLLQICICLFVVLTFSFALPACFCTVFAINAPLLSAIFFKLFEKRWLYNFSPQNTISTSKLNRLSFTTNHNQNARTEARRNTEDSTRNCAPRLDYHFYKAAPTGSTVHAR